MPFARNGSDLVACCPHPVLVGRAPRTVEHVPAGRRTDRFRYQFSVGDDVAFVVEPPRADVGGDRLALFDGGVGVAAEIEQHVDVVPSQQPDRPPLIGQTDLVHGASPRDGQRGETPGDQHFQFDVGARRRQHHPVAVRQPAQLSQLGRHLTEHFGLQFAEPRQVSVGHRPRPERFGEAIGRDDEGVPGIVIGPVIRVVVAHPFDAVRVGLLAIERVGCDAFDRLIVRRQWTVAKRSRRPEPAFTVGVQEEWVDTRNRIQTRRARLGPVVGWPVDDEVGNVVTGPGSDLIVPPHVRLAFRPGTAVRVGRRTVVHVAPVRGPCPTPVGRHPVLFGCRNSARCLVGALGEHTDVNPRAG